jgi:hypothetical protein
MVRDCPTDTRERSSQAIDEGSSSDQSCLPIIASKPAISVRGATFCTLQAMFCRCRPSAAHAAIAAGLFAHAKATSRAGRRSRGATSRPDEWTERPRGPRRDHALSYPRGRASLPTTCDISIAPGSSGHRRDRFIFAISPRLPLQRRWHHDRCAPDSCRLAAQPNLAKSGQLRSRSALLIKKTSLKLVVKSLDHGMTLAAHSGRGCSP